MVLRRALPAIGAGANGRGIVGEESEKISDGILGGFLVGFVNSSGAAGGEIGRFPLRSGGCLWAVRNLSSAQRAAIQTDALVFSAEFPSVIISLLGKTGGRCE